MMSSLRQLYIILFIFIYVFFDVSVSYAHSPHDVIDALAISPAYNLIKVLFIIVKSESFLKSLDGGFSWKSLEKGIDNKHSLSSVAVSPNFHHDSTVFLSSEGDGIYKSINGGLSWFKVNNGLNNLSISFISPSFNFQYDKIVLAAGSNGGLYKTKNGGDMWYQVIDESTKLTSIALIPDSENNSIIIGDVNGITYISYDNGENWQRLFHLQNCGAITSIAVSPDFSSDRNFFIGTQRNGVYRTTDGGVSFTEVNNGIGVPYITSIVLSPDYKRNPTIFVSTWYDATFKSEDGGETWKKYNKGLTTDHQADSEMYKSPHFRDVRVSKNFSNDKTIFLGGFDGLFKSTNGGDCWLQLETKPLKIIKSLGISPANNNNYTIAISTYGGGAYTSSDKGATWLINNSGLKTTRLSDIVFSPNYHLNGNIFSASKNHFLKSEDRGSRWTKIRLHNRRKNSIREILRKWISKRFAGKSKIKGTWPTLIAVSPAFASDNIVFFGTRNHGVFRSNDGGLNFFQVWDSMGKKNTSVIISPDFALDKTLFVGVRAWGIYKSVDGGNRWKAMNNGFEFIKDVILTISPNYKVDKTLFAAAENQLFKTIDGGINWREISSDTYGKDGIIKALAISPSYGEDRTLIISVKGKGLFKTEDGGVTWIEIGSELINNNHSLKLIEFSPIYPTGNTIYGASEEELFKSINAGNTWEVIRRPVRYENMRDVIQYEGVWKALSGNDFSAMSISYSDVANSKVILDFVGSGISWIGTKSNEQGIAKVYIDGVFKDNVDQFSIERKVMEESFTLRGLSLGHHTIMIEVTDNKNPESSGNRIEIDAFDVI